MNRQLAADDFDEIGDRLRKLRMTEAEVAETYGKINGNIYRLSKERRIPAGTQIPWDIISEAGWKPFEIREMQKHGIKWIAP